MAKPSTVVLEFLTWFAWLACFALLQSRLCLRYPGIRRVCRQAYMFTMILPIGASVWWMARAGSGPELFAVLNHAFGAGVFAQTFLRSVVLLKWLVASGVSHQVSIPAGGAAQVLYTHSDMAKLVGILGPVLRPRAAQRFAPPPRSDRP